MNRIKLLREEKGLNQIELGKIINVSGQALGMYENEKRDLSTDTVIKLAEFFNVSTDYLLGKSEERNIFNKKDKLFILPILGKIAAGQPILAEQYIEGYLPIDPNIYGMTTPDDYFYLRVSGESMNLKIHNGDYALIHKQETAKDGDIVVAIVNGDDEATLKKYKRISDDTIALEPMSTLPMEPIYVDLKETNFKIIGKAIGQFGKF